MGLLEQKDKLDVNLYQYLEALHGAPLTQTQMYLIVRQWRFIPCYDPEFTRLVLSLRDAQILKLLIPSYEQRGFLSQGSFWAAPTSSVRLQLASWSFCLLSHWREFRSHCQWLQ